MIIKKLNRYNYVDKKEKRHSTEQVSNLLYKTKKKKKRKQQKPKKKKKKKTMKKKTHKVACAKKNAKKNAKTTATSIPMWSPTIVLTDLDTV